MASLNQDIIKLIPIDVCDISIQEKIVYVLSIYDELIENNNRRIAILEEMAQRLYREWFVNFRFPGHENINMVHATDLGIIPETWRFEVLKNIAYITMGQSPSSDYYNENGQGLPFHQGVTNYGAIIPEHNVYCSKPNRLAEDGDILFSVRAPVGRINIADGKMCLGRGLSAIRSKHNKQAFLYFSLKDQFRVIDSIGNGSIFNSVTKKDMENILVLLPDETISSEFERIAEPIVKKLIKLTKQNITLRKTRDLLLPRLISGAIDVSNIELSSEECR